MNRVEQHKVYQYHSAAHASDGRYHIFSKCMRCRD